VAITHHDLNRLIHEPSPKVRSYIAAKVSEQYNEAQFTPNEAKIALEIFRLLLRDTAIVVRKSIAENLKASPHVPRDIILALANDVSDIAVPVLESSELLTDEDLMDIVRSTHEVRKWLAISRRQNLSARVSRHLVATRSELVVVSLLGNRTSEISESDLDYLLNEFRHEQDVLEALVCRGGLNPRIAEKLYFLVSTQLKKQLTKKYRLPWQIASQEVDLAREAAILRFLSLWMSDDDVALLVEQMMRSKRLSISLTLRALAQGERRFFEVALAARAHVPLENARKLLSDRGPLGFRTLCLSAGLPSHFIDALDVIYRFSITQPRETEATNEAYTQRLLEYIRAGQYDQNVLHMNALITFITAADHELRTLH
jgi:uncharacterized protein (DUF2336 family)